MTIGSVNVNHLEIHHPDFVFLDEFNDFLSVLEHLTNLLFLIP